MYQQELIKHICFQQINKMKMIKILSKTIIYKIVKINRTGLLIISLMIMKKNLRVIVHM